MAKKQSFDNSAFEEFDNSAFEEFDNSAFEELSTEQEETVKKKDQEEVSSEELLQKETPQMEVQEDTESVSEDGSLDLSQIKPAGSDVPAIIETEGVVPIEDFSKQEENKASLFKAEKAIPLNLGQDFDYLSNTTEEISDNLPAEIDDNAAFQFIEQKKNNALNKLGSDYYNKMISDSSKAYLESGEAEDIEEAKDFTARDYLKSMRNLGINSLGLDEEQLVKYKQDINDFYKLRQIPSSKRTLEQKAEIHRLKDVIKNLREDSERFFINPETGEIDGEKRKVVKDLTAKYSQEAKTDFQKFSERYKREFDNLNAIDKTLVEAYFGDKLEEAKGEFGLFGKISLEDISRMAKADKLPDISQKGKVNSLLQEKEKSQLNFDALSRALLLNEDPAAVAKGFGSLEGTAIGDLPIIPFTDYTVSDIVKGTGADIFATAFGESFAEAIPGVGNVKSDRDFRKDIVRIANEEGVTLREDQYDSAVATMAEKLGDTFGTSAEIMAEIIATTLITKNASSAINVAGRVGKLVDFFGGGKKAARIAGESLKALEQAIAFDLTSQGSAAMGMGEFLGAKGADKVLNLLSKGKTAKFMKFFKPLTRVMGATTAGTVEEYGGEYLEQGFKNGFISKETFRNTFGRDYDEAKDKLLMTLILTGTFGTGAEVANMYKLGKDYYKDSGDQTQLNDVEKAYVEIQKAKQEKLLTKFDDMSEEELEKYAEENNVDISNLKKDISAARKAKKLDDMSQEELEKYAEENDISIEDLEVLTAEKEKIKSDDKKEGEPVPSAVEEGQEPGDIQVDETGEEEVTAGGVLQEEEVVTEGQQVSSDMVVDDELSNPDEDGSIFDLIDNSSSVKVTKVNGVSERGTSVDLKIVTEDGVVERTVFLKPKKEVADVEPGDINAKSEETVEADTFTQEELETPEVESKLTEEQKKVNNISKAINKVAPGVEFVFHKTEDSYNNSSEQDVSGSRGYRDGDKVHIDLSSVKDNTSFHEAIHPVLDAVFNKSPETYNKLVSSMKTDPEFESYFESAKQNYEGENTQVNEALTEMMADVASGKYNKGTSVYEKVKDFVKEILSKLGLRQSDFNIDLNKEVDVRQFAENIGKALAKGKEITFEKEGKLIQEKIADAVSKGKESLLEVSKSYFESTKDNLSDIALKAYEKINGTSKVTQEGFTKALEKSKEFAKEVADIVSKGKESLLEVSKSYFESTKDNLSDIALKAYEKINGTSKVTQEGFTKALEKSKEFAKEVADIVSKGKDFVAEKIPSTKDVVESITEKLSKPVESAKEFRSVLSEVISEGKDSFYEKVNNTSKITSEGISKATKKAKESLDKTYEKVKDNISGKALDIYKSINKTAEITKEGFIKASIVSKNFLNEVLKVYAKGLDALGDIAKESSRFVVGLSAAAVISNSYPVIKGYNKMGVDGAIYEVIKENKWAVDALQGTELGDKLNSALGRLEFKTGDAVGGESVSIEEANEVSKTVKSVEEISVEDDVSPEVRKFIADNTTFEISKKKIPLSRRGKRMGVSAHIQNQFPADSGFIYISAPTVGSNVPFSADALAVAQFQLDGSISDNQTYKGGESEYTKGVPGHYMHKNNDAILRVAKQRNDYVPVFEKLGDNKVRVRYKRYNELEKGERIMSPLRQFKYSEIAWGQETQASDFAKGMKALPLKKGVKYPYPGKKGGNQTDIIFGGTYKNPRTGKVSKGSDRYGLYEGIGAVFIFKDKNGTTWVREFNGSANQVAAKGREIIKEFNIKPEDLTVGYHDVGSYSARPLAEKGKVGTNLYTGKKEYNSSPETGGALYYPPKDVNFQKKGGQRGDTFNKAKESYKKSREAGLDIKESISESFKTIERADWYKSLTKEEQAEIKADYVNRLVPNFESEGKPPKRNRKGKPPVDSSRKIITTEKKSLLAKLKNQAKGAKTLMKAQTGLINELFKEISNSSKSLTSNELKAVLKKASKLDPADITKVLEFKDEVKKLIDKGEIRDKKKLAFSNRARINKAKKKLTGKKKAFADTFSKLNINRVTDLDAYNEVAQSIIDSANKRKASSLEIIKKLGDRVISETNKAQEDFNAERQRLSDIALEEEFEAFQESMYEKSSFKKRGGSLEEYKKFLSSEEGFMSLEDYKRIKEQAYRESLSNQSREKIEKAEQQLRDFISNRLEYLKSNKESITKDMTPFEKAVVNDLIKSASLLKRTDLTSSDNLFDISQALDEILTFNSTSGVNKASVALDAIRDSNIAKIRLKDKLASGILAGYPTAGSLSTYVKAATKNEQAAKEFASLFFGKYNDSFNKSQNKTEQFLKRRAEKRNELKIKRKESQRIGIVSWLMQHDEGSTEEEIQLDLDQKKESIKQQIKTLSGSKGNASDRRKAKRMQEAYDSLGLDNVKTKKELNALLNKNELDFLNFLTEEFQELKQPLQDAYSAAKGEDLTFVENYLPTFARKYSDTSKEDLEGLVFDNKSIQSNPSGRTKKRTKIDTTGNVIYNFDVLGTTEAGYSQAAGDIYTLYDKQVLSQVVMSKPVKELWKNDPKGYRTFKERVALLLKNRNPNYATDAARANRFLQISNNILRTAIALPLRTTDQLGKQVVPIIGNTVAKLVLSRGRPVAGVKGFSYIGSLMGSDSSPTKQNLKKLLSFSNTSLRVLEGDRDLAATKGLTEQAQKKILEAVRLGKLNEKVLSKLGSGALGFADKLASQGSWLSFYISERIDQEGKGFKFDLEKEAENPNMKAIEKANVETDWINNKSDMTTAAKSVYENKKTALLVKDLFFLFKSFAINQSYNAALDIRNIGYGVSKSFKKKESKEGRQDARDAAGSLLGTVAGVYLFEMVKESFIKPGTDELVEALFDIEDPDPEKEVLGDIKRDSKQAFMKGAMDIVVGAAPESISRGFKEYANSLIIDAAKEDYEELKNKFPGADIEPFSEYKQKVFYDKSSAPGFLGRTGDLGAETFRDFQIITGDEGLGQEDQFGREKELSPKMKTIALLNMLAPFVGAGDIKKYTEKALRNAKKNAKNKK